MRKLFHSTFGSYHNSTSICIIHAYKTLLDECNCAFLNRYLNEELYVSQTPRFEIEDLPNHVFELNKALNDLK